MAHAFMLRMSSVWFVRLHLAWAMADMCIERAMIPLSDLFAGRAR